MVYLVECGVFFGRYSLSCCLFVCRVGSGDKDYVLSHGGFLGF